MEYTETRSTLKMEYDTLKNTSTLTMQLEYTCTSFRSTKINLSKLLSMGCSFKNLDTRLSNKYADGQGGLDWYEYLISGCT
jgi:hypothetical protein